MAFKHGKLKFRLRPIKLELTPIPGPFSGEIYMSSEFNTLCDMLYRSSRRTVYQYRCTDPKEQRIGIDANNLMRIPTEVVFFVAKGDEFFSYRADPVQSRQLMDRTLSAAQLSPQDWVKGIRDSFGIYTAQVPIDKIKAQFDAQDSFSISATIHYGFFRMVHKETRAKEWLVLALPTGVTFQGEFIKKCNAEISEISDYFRRPPPETYTFIGNTKRSVKLMIKVAKRVLAERKSSAKEQLEMVESVTELMKKHEGENLGETYKKSRKTHKKIMERLDKRVWDARQRLKDLREKLGELTENED